MVHPLTGEVVRTNICHRRFCPVCFPHWVDQRARAIRTSQPERFVRYSVNRPTTPSEMRDSINSLHRRLRASGIAYEAAWHVEPNRDGQGAHVHLWQHGSFVPRQRLLELARRSHFDDVWIEAWEDHSLAGYRYGMKLAAIDVTREVLRYWNRGRLGSNTRAFWRIGQNGPPVTLNQAGSRRNRRSAGVELEGRPIGNRDGQPHDRSGASA